MTTDKESFGIRLHHPTVEKLDDIIKESSYLNATRSELIEAIINAFLATDFNHLEKGREFIITKRKHEGEESEHSVDKK